MFETIVLILSTSILFFLILLLFFSLKALKKATLSMREQAQTYESLETLISRVYEDIGEVRFEVRLINARIPQTLNVVSHQEKIPYAGAKRGPKPKGGHGHTTPE